MIYYAKRHRGTVTVNGVEVAAVHADTVLGYAVVFPTTLVVTKHMVIERSVVRGRVEFKPKRRSK